MNYLFVLLYIFVVLVRPHEFYEPLMMVPVMPVLFSCGFVGWLMSREVRINSPQHIMVTLLCVAMILSQAASGWIGGIPYLLSMKLPVFILFFMLASMMNTTSRIENFLFVYLVSAVIMAIHGILQSETGVGWTGASTVEGGRITYIGIFNDPNDLGQILISAIPFAVYFYAKNKSWLLKLAYLVSGGGLLYGIVLTDSRGTMVAFLAMLGLYIYQRYGKAKTIVLAALILPVVTVFSSRMSDLDASGESAAGRVEAWYTALELFRENPLFGVGVGNFTEFHHLTAHNSYLLTLAELGFVGYYFWFSLVILCFHVIYQSQNVKIFEDVHDGKLSEEVKISIALSRAILFSMVSYFASAFFLSRSFGIVLFMICGLATAQYLNVLRDSLPTVNLLFSRVYMRLFMIVIGSILFLYIVVKVLL